MRRGSGSAGFVRARISLSHLVFQPVSVISLRTDGLHCYAIPRHAEAADWQSNMPEHWPTSRGSVPGLTPTESPQVSAAAAAGKAK